MACEIFPQTPKVQFSLWYQEPSKSKRVFLRPWLPSHFCEQLRNTMMDTWELPLWREQIVALAESQGIMDHLHHNFMLPPAIPTKSSAKHTSNGANGIVCSFVGSSAYSQKNLNLSACSSTWTRHTRSGKWQALQEDYLKSPMRGNSS